jgi:hypothetical protein
MKLAARRAAFPGPAPAQTLECGHDWIVWETLVGIKNEGLVRVLESMRAL